MAYVSKPRRFRCVWRAFVPLVVLLAWSGDLASALLAPGRLASRPLQQGHHLDRAALGSRRGPAGRVKTRTVVRVGTTPFGGGDGLDATSLTTAYEFAGSYASLYATLGLYALSFPGLYSLVKRSVKVQLVQKTFVFEDEPRAMKEIAGEVVAYMKANNYDVAEAGETVKFRGLFEASKSQAFFLSFCAFVGLASLALVLQIQLPAVGAYWYLSTLLSPFAGIYYWQNAQQENEFEIKLEDRGEADTEQTTETTTTSAADRSTKALVVRGGKEDVERMARVMDLQEEGMVRVRGILESTIS